MFCRFLKIEIKLSHSEFTILSILKHIAQCLLEYSAFYNHHFLILKCFHHPQKDPRTHQQSCPFLLLTAPALALS